MPFQVRLSQIQDVAAFKAAIEAHISCLHAFNYEKGKPRPTTHPLIEACIKRTQTPNKPDTYSADYDIIDDVPKTEATNPTLDDKKYQARLVLAKVEQAAKNKLLPAGKIRLANLEYSFAVRSPEGERTQEQQAAISNFAALQEKMQQIELVAARAEAAIEDCVEDTIDSWLPPTFE